MDNNLKIENIFAKNAPIPHNVGGENWNILHGDMLSIVRNIKSSTFDAVITDPPYSSGGAKASDKTRTTNQKYSSMSSEKALPDFDGDQKDGRSWTNWAAEWLAEMRRITKPGGVIGVFIDWRMAPSLSDALQWAGWIWRGQVVWDKPNSRPQKGRFRQQSEYLLWASNGPMPLNRPVGCLPGVYRYSNPSKRVHVTEKPLQLMQDVIKICEPNGLILDPFAGSGTTVLAAAIEGYKAVGVEVTDAYFDVATQRIAEALAKTKQ